MVKFATSVVNFVRKLVLVVSVFVIVITLFVYFINKHKVRDTSTEIIKSQRKELYKIIDNKDLQKNTFGKYAVAIYRLTTCSIVGELCTDIPSDGESFFKTSLLGRTTELISFPYTNPPASGMYWALDSFQKAGLIPQTYAAEGIGFASIKPLMSLWKIFRDVAYLCLVLVMIVIGFMIMFRMKINPQTVISVENALPKIVITLILITFSFAIAGLLIDIMYILIVLSIGLLSNNNTYYDTNTMQSTFLDSGFGTLYQFLMPADPTQVKAWPWTNFSLMPLFPRMTLIGDAFMSFFPNWVDAIGRIIAVGGTLWLVGARMVDQSNSVGIQRLLNGLDLFGNSLGEMPHPIIGGILSFFFYMAAITMAIHGFGFIIGILVMLTFTGMLFRVFFILIRAYIQIIVTIVLSPIILLFEALPGKSVFSFWVKGLIGELITFPTVIVILLVAKILINTLSSPGEFWAPPLIMGSSGINSTGFGIILGMGLVFILPDLIKFVKEGIGAKPLPFSIGPGTFFGGAGGLVGSGVGMLGQFSTINLGLTALTGGNSNLLDRVKGLGKGLSYNKPKPQPLQTGGDPPKEQ